MDHENLAMMLIVNAGNAKSLAMEAIQKAKSGDFSGAEEKLKESDKAMAQAHEQQTDLLQDFLENSDLKINMLTVHAQDHLMCAITVLDQSREFCDVYRMFFEMKKEVHQ